MKRYLKIALAFLLLGAFFVPMGFAGEPSVSVGLASGVSNCTLKANSITFYDASGKQASFRGTVSVSAGGRNNIAVGGKNTSSSGDRKVEGLALSKWQAL